MARRRTYITGALVEARNSKYGNGLGIILAGPEMKNLSAHGYQTFGEAQEWFKVHWFKKPGSVDAYYMLRGNGQVDMTRNQIKLMRSR